jgi:hypothetical protein
MDTMAEGRMGGMTDGSHGGYEPPALSVIGSAAELTLGCDKTWGKSDGFTFQGTTITCASP